MKEICLRNAFVKAIGELAAKDPRLVFLTGDLGFMALEPLRAQLGERFMNAGIAEQNMVSMAAGIASRGLIPWIYSITPFVSLRPFEQLRNDVGLHRLPVRVVGNGGGFGYGIMGSTHHALEDLGCFRLLPHFKSAIPVYASDVEEAVTWMNDQPGPVYLRLNLEAPGPSPAPFQSWRRVKEGDKAVVVTIGPVLGEMLSVLEKLPEESFEVYSVGILPFTSVPQELLEKIERSGILITFEEHIAAGGLGESLAAHLLGKLKTAIRYLPLAATGYPSGRYGSQKWHLQENGLKGESLESRIKTFLGRGRAK